jgi:hypothetical protein
VATRRREITQRQARKLHEDVRVAGLAWWSIYESLWINVTLFDRAATLLRRHSVRTLGIEDPAVIEAARYFELRVG